MTEHMFEVTRYMVIRPNKTPYTGLHERSSDALIFAVNCSKKSWEKMLADGFRIAKVNYLERSAK